MNALLRVLGYLAMLLFALCWLVAILMPNTGY